MSQSYFFVVAVLASLAVLPVLRKLGVKARYAVIVGPAVALVGLVAWVPFSLEAFGHESRQVGFRNRLEDVRLSLPGCVVGNGCDRSKLEKMLSMGVFACAGWRSAEHSGLQIPSGLVELSSQGVLVAASYGISKESPDYWVVFPHVVLAVSEVAGEVGRGKR